MRRFIARRLRLVADKLDPMPRLIVRFDDQLVEDATVKAFRRYVRLNGVRGLV